ncbi:MAG: hypothetical protein ACLGGX_09460 [Bdellovibrionia bacterium]
MQQNKIKYFEKPEKKQHKDFISSQNNCVLCGTVLELRHVVDQETHQIKEEAYCQHCEVRTRMRTYQLN